MSQAVDYSNGIIGGLIKAAMMLAEQNKRRAESPPRKPRYIYVDGPPVLHAKKFLNKENRARFEAVKAEIALATTTQEIEEALAYISDIKIKSVPTKRALLQDYSRDYRKPRTTEALAA